MKQKIFFLLIFKLLLALNVVAQNTNEIFAFANQQFEQENYAIALKEYNRAFFFNYSDKGRLSLQIGHCYQKSNELDLAIDFYNKAFRLATSDSIKTEALLNNAFCYLVKSEFVLALNELYNIKNDVSAQQRIHYHFLSGIAHFGMENDSIAYSEFSEVLKRSNCEVESQELLHSEFEKIYKVKKRYRPKVGYVMSGILPGSGQFYAGSVKDGINSMLLIGGLYFAAIKVMQYYSFWDGVVALFPWVQRYYLGGMDNAKKLTIEKGQAKRNESYEKIVELTYPENL